MEAFFGIFEAKIWYEFSFQLNRFNIEFPFVKSSYCKQKTFRGLRAACVVKFYNGFTTVKVPWMCLEFPTQTPGSLLLRSLVQCWLSFAAKINVLNNWYITLPCVYFCFYSSNVYKIKCSYLIKGGGYSDRGVKSVLSISLL